MSPIHYIQFIVFSFCIHLFTVFIYIVYYADLLYPKFIKHKSAYYDYIIVGSGTAGSIITYRIATETNYSVILLEAGSRSNALLEIPVLAPLLHGSIFDWQYETKPQEGACLAMSNRKCRLIHGKILGGSSKLNNMIHFRGNISQYISWFNDGTKTESYIKKQFDFIENKVLHLNDLQFESELADAVLAAGAELGYGNLHSSFGKGFAKPNLSQNNGKRWSSSDNLDITNYVLTNALVEKVLFNGNTAYGVNIALPDKKITVYARKAVVLSAGAYNTPKILQLSGIGPRSLLKSLSIPVKRDLPVGRNLQDHITTGLDLVLLNSSLSMSATAILNPINAFNYFLRGKGPLTSPGCELIGFASTKNESYPDLQFMVLPVGISSDRGSSLKNILGISDRTWNNYFGKSFDKHSATILPIILHPKSKGTVFIKSRDPKVPPSIDPKFFYDIEDLEILKRGVRLVFELVSTSSMKSIGAYINPLVFPGCEKHTLFSDAYLECYVRHLTLTSYHPAGTCAMGSVVDTSFRVYGFRNLFVVDASAMPALPSGNINAAISMLASVFYDTNIKSYFKQNKCYKCDLIHEFVYNICI